MGIHYFFDLLLLFSVALLAWKNRKQSILIKSSKKVALSDKTLISKLLRDLRSPKFKKIDLTLLEKIDDANLFYSNEVISDYFNRRFFSEQEWVNVQEIGDYILHLDKLPDSRKKTMLESYLHIAALMASTEILEHISSMTSETFENINANTDMRDPSATNKLLALSMVKLLVLPITEKRNRSAIVV